MELFAGVGLIQGDSVGVKSCPVELGLISAVKGIAESHYPSEIPVLCGHSGCYKAFYEM